MTDYPETEKVIAVSKQSQAIGEFVNDWLAEKGIRLCQLVNMSETGVRLEWMPVHTPITDMLAEFFEIDLAKLEDEKVRALEEFRAANR